MNKYRGEKNKNTETSSDIIDQQEINKVMSSHRQINKQGFSDVKIKVYRCKLTW